MVSFAAVVVGIAALLTGYALVRYVQGAHRNLLRARENCDRAWGNVEVLLERRYDEVGSLVDLARQHVSHERALLETVVDARQHAIEADTPREAAKADTEIRASMSELYKLSEEYPELRAVDRFDELSDSIRGIEGRLESRREYYNEAVASYNARRRSFPEIVFARVHDFGRREAFSASDRAYERIDVGERLGLDDR